MEEVKAEEVAEAKQVGGCGFEYFFNSRTAAGDIGCVVSTTVLYIASKE